MDTELILPKSYQELAQKIAASFPADEITEITEDVFKASLLKLPPTYITVPNARIRYINELPERYIINKGATILFWEDGSKTIVKRCKDDKYNKRLGFLTAYFQKHCGMSKNKANKYLAGLVDEEQVEEKDYERWYWSI